MPPFPRGLLAVLGGLLCLTPHAAGAAAKLPKPPDLRSVRGLPPGQREEIDDQNRDTLYAWLQELPEGQRLAWHRANGQPNPEESRRLGSATLPDSKSGYQWRASAQGAGLKDAGGIL